MPKIYIGVGHGGSDPGAVSGKHTEKNYALDIANACTVELRRCGVIVMQSRTTDTTESAAAKIVECNAFNPNAALDIHLNAGGGDGFEVYHGINSTKGKIFARSIEKAVTAETGQNSRGVKTKLNSSGKDYFGFIRQTKCTALLVECAFIDSKDVQIVDTLAERQKMGKAIAHGVLDWLGISTKAEKPSGGAVASENSANPSGSAGVGGATASDTGLAGAGSSDTNSSGNAVSASVVKLPDVAVLLPQLSREFDNPEYQVKRVQLCLNEMGYTGANDAPLTVDGDFGVNTEAAVKKLQAAHNIPTDGRMTAKTWRALLAFRR